LLAEVKVAGMLVAVVVLVVIVPALYL